MGGKKIINKRTQLKIPLSTIRAMSKKISLKLFVEICQIGQSEDDSGGGETKSIRTTHFSWFLRSSRFEINS